MRSIGEVFFKINFNGVNFEARNEMREKNVVVWVLNKTKEWSEKKSFFISLYSREREIEMKRKILKPSKIFSSRVAFKSSFLQFLSFYVKADFTFLCVFVI